ncbi:hypothetical protein SAMN05428969_3105 [Devosia sp. YR412]|uniref:hypothetical protein n=1 Tax=Devosia sp. YR412 TaxID=1881030 RepID=UPI0008C47329|nr:hypothetical protein [Devosia sp. YR412]SEQ43799.1 hypothetical protein SAMN05428969_3105 [Devosia sp. YR412]
MTSVTLDDALVEGLKQFIAEHDEPPGGRMSAQDAVNVIVQDWLMAQGYIALPGDSDAITTAAKASQLPKPECA